MGPHVKKGLDVVLTVAQLSFIISYYIYNIQTLSTIIVGKDNLDTNSDGEDDKEPGSLLRLALTVGMFILEIPLVSVRDLNKLGITSLLGWIALMVGMIMTVARFDYSESGTAISLCSFSHEY
tara:strand:- start:53 stop:421 length:369 start_codon:yes stop_codon:yes gene_type:complete